MKPIQIYPYDRLPRELSTGPNKLNIDDCDWVAIIPNKIQQRYDLGFLLEGHALGCCHIEKFKHKNYPKCEIWAGCHA